MSSSSAAAGRENVFPCAYAARAVICVCVCVVSVECRTLCHATAFNCLTPNQISRPVSDAGARATNITTITTKRKSADLVNVRCSYSFSLFVFFQSRRIEWRMVKPINTWFKIKIIKTKQKVKRESRLLFNGLWGLTRTGPLSCFDACVLVCCRFPSLAEKKLLLLLL